MAAGQYNIIIEKGTTFGKTLTVKDDVGDAVDLTGASARAKFRTKAQDGSSYTFTMAVTDAANGIISWDMDAATTTTLPSGKGVYDLEIVYSDASVDRILTGNVTVSEFINRTDV